MTESPQPEPQTPPNTRCGLVAVVGRPNVGKSTLTNALVGFKVSAISPKPQTTRHRILGIATHDDVQMILVDTPGMQRKVNKAMNRYMNRTVHGSLVDVSHVLFVVEAGQFRDEDEAVLALLRDQGLPVSLVINKVDRVPDKEGLLPYIAETSAKHPFAHTFLISAQKRKGLDELFQTIAQTLPHSEHAFADDDVTDKSMRFLVNESIREHLMRKLGAELPYASTVSIEKWTETPALLTLHAVIYVERDSQKGIVIGAGGKQIKRIGTDARKAIERLMDKKVHLELWCKVRSGWSDDERALNEFGYNG